MTCGELRPILDLYLDGGMRPDDEDALGRHLARCSACQAFVEDDLLLGERVRATLHGRGRGARSRRPRLALAASLLLAVGLGFAAGRVSLGPAEAPPGPPARTAPSAGSAAAMLASVSSATPNPARLAARVVELEGRVGDLVRDRRRLELLMGARRVRRGARAPVDPGDLIAGLAARLRRERPAAGDATMRWSMAQARALGRMFDGRSAEVLAAVERELLTEGASGAQQLLALVIIGRMRHPGSVPLVQPFVASSRNELRLAAVETLARLEDPAGRTALSRVFRSGRTPRALRVSAAGGLVRLGDTRAPLDWLVGAYGRERSPALRRRIFGRIVQAPPERIRGFIHAAARDPRLGSWERQQTVEILGQLRDAASREVLERLLEEAWEPELRMMIVRALDVSI